MRFWTQAEYGLKNHEWTKSNCAISYLYCDRGLFEVAQKILNPKSSGGDFGFIHQIILASKLFLQTEVFRPNNPPEKYNK